MARRFIKLSAFPQSVPVWISVDDIVGVQHIEIPTQVLGEKPSVHCLVSTRYGTNAINQHAQQVIEAIGAQVIEAPEPPQPPKILTLADLKTKGGES